MFTVSIAFRAILLFRRRRSAACSPTSSRVSIAFRAILLFRQGLSSTQGCAEFEFQSPSGRFFYLDSGRTSETRFDAWEFQSPSGRFFYLDTYKQTKNITPTASQVSIAFRAILLFRPGVSPVLLLLAGVSIAFRAILLFRQERRPKGVKNGTTRFNRLQGDSSI